LREQIWSGDRGTIVQDQSAELRPLSRAQNPAGGEERISCAILQVALPA